ncbi:hypothetical protein Q5P01_018551 [Channa striata]|uniref:Uncharacterized protein n=1 Tax=Channa striata TaxID=64152 RepID=A0AA88M4P3_CHASR|nr:hypothetical protein Q5P01_018551 [Channa striata]
MWFFGPALYFENPATAQGTATEHRRNIDDTVRHGEPSRGEKVLPARLSQKKLCVGLGVIAEKAPPACLPRSQCSVDKCAIDGCN